MWIFKSPRLSKRIEAKQKLKILDDNKLKTFVIHYSCESFYNLEGRTPRITSICVKNRESGEAKVFSIHLQAQFSNIDLTNANDDIINRLEQEMLNDFGDFVDANKGYYWVHWNMRNATYGFEAISNRSRIVNSRAINIEDDRKIDLLKILIQLYTKRFEDDQPNGKMLNVANYNGISTRDALAGKEEAEAFDNNDYLKLHMSTLRKVEVIERIIEEVDSESLKVKAKKRQIYGLTFLGIIHLVKESPVLLISWTILMFIVGAALEPIIQKIFGTS